MATANTCTPLDKTPSRVDIDRSTNIYCPVSDGNIVSVCGRKVKRVFFATGWRNSRRKYIDFHSDNEYSWPSSPFPLITKQYVPDVRHTFIVSTAFTLQIVSLTNFELPTSRWTVINGNITSELAGGVFTMPSQLCDHAIFCSTVYTLLFGGCLTQ
jgi:hypothetical protein